MRAEAVQEPSRDLFESLDQSAAPPASLLTPARAAALDALERELAEFLKGQQPQAA